MARPIAVVTDPALPPVVNKEFAANSQVKAKDKRRFPPPSPLPPPVEEGEQ